LARGATVHELPGAMSRSMLAASARAKAASCTITALSVL
jgi:hypothetical protein